MPIRLSCPACSKRLRVEEEMAGKRIKCPACANAFEVPAQPNRPEGEVSKAAPPRPEKRILWPWVISGVSALLLVVVSAMWLMSGGNTQGRTGEQGADGELAMKAEVAKVKAEAERTNSELVGAKADLAKVKADLESAKAEGESLKSDLGKARAEAEAATTKLAQAQAGAKPQPVGERTKPPKKVTNEVSDWPFARGTAEGTAVVAHAGPTSEPAIVWKFKSAGPDPAGAMGSMSCTPVVRDGIVYWGSDDGILYALRASNGEKVWEYAVNMKPKTGEGQVLGSAALSDKHVFASFFGKGVVCLERATGKQLWRKEFVLTVSSPVVVKDKVFFGHSNGLTGYDDSGEEVFSFRPPAGVGAKGAVFGVITGSQTHICFGSDNGHAYALQFPDGSKKWDGDLSLFLVRGAVAISKDEAVVCVSDTLICLDLKTGKQLWKKTFDKDDYLSNPAVGEDYLIVATSKGKVYRLSRKDGQPQWTHDEKEAGCQSPIVGKNLVYLTVKRKLLALDLATGQKRWECGLPADAASVPSLADGMLFLSGSDGILYALGTKKAATGEGTQPSRPGAKATPSQLLGRFTHSDFLKTPVDMVFIPADQQRQLTPLRARRRQADRPALDAPEYLRNYW